MELRLCKVERREEALIAREEELAHKEREVSAYVAQVQAGLDRRAQAAA